MCDTLGKIPEKERFHLTLEEIKQDIEKGNRVLKEFIKKTKDYETIRKI